MSIISRKLQSQLLLLRYPFIIPDRISYNAVTHNLNFNIYNNAHFDAYKSAHEAISDVTYHATDRFICDEILNIVYYNSFDTISNIIRKSKTLDNAVSLCFCEVFKMDTKIQDHIEQVECNLSPRSERELVESLIVIDISKMIPLVQTYWLYSLHHCICAISDTDDSIILMEKYKEKHKNLKLPCNYTKLLNPPELEYPDNILIKPILKIVTDYYGLMDRRSFFRELLRLMDI